MTELINTKRKYINALRRLVVHMQGVNKAKAQTQTLTEKHGDFLIYLRENSAEVKELERVLGREYRKLKSWGM